MAGEQGGGVRQWLIDYDIQIMYKLHKQQECTIQLWGFQPLFHNNI